MSENIIKEIKACSEFSLRVDELETLCNIETSENCFRCSDPFCKKHLYYIKICSGCASILKFYYSLDNKIDNTEKRFDEIKISLSPKFKKLIQKRSKKLKFDTYPAYIKSLIIRDLKLKTDDLELKFESMD